MPSLRTNNSKICQRQNTFDFVVPVTLSNELAKESQSIQASIGFVFKFLTLILSISLFIAIPYYISLHAAYYYLGDNAWIMRLLKVGQLITQTPQYIVMIFILVVVVVSTY